MRSSPPRDLDHPARMAHAETRRCGAGLPILHLSDIGDTHLLQVVRLAEERAAHKDADAGRGRVAHRGWTATCEPTRSQLGDRVEYVLGVGRNQLRRGKRV